MKYFKKEELECPCCGRSNMERHMLEMLETARALAGVPFVVEAPGGSACRCWLHNKKVGGSETSSHLIEDKDGNEKECCAVDIKCVTSFDRFRILRGLIDAGFNRIGIAKTFIHADSDSSKSFEVTWMY